MTIDRRGLSLFLSPFSCDREWRWREKGKGTKRGGKERERENEGGGGGISFQSARKAI